MKPTRFHALLVFNAALLLFTLAASATRAQDLQVPWVAQLSAVGDSTASDCKMAVDSAGNLFVAGAVWGSLHGAFEFKPASLTKQNLYFAKLDSKGQLLWLKSTEAPDSGKLKLLGGAAVDAFGNLLVVGDIAPGSTTLDGQLLSGMFVAKFSPDGQVLWTKNFNVGWFGNPLTHITTDSKANVIVGGSFRETLSVDDLSFSSQSSRLDGFLARLSPDGNLLWARQISVAPGGYDGLVGRALQVDPAGGIYLGGHFTPELPPEAVHPRAVLVHYSADGDEQWTLKAEGSGNSSIAIRGLAVDGGGRARCLVTFNKSIDLGGFQVEANPDKSEGLVATVSTTGAVESVAPIHHQGQPAPSALYGLLAVDSKDNTLLIAQTSASTGGGTLLLGTNTIAIPENTGLLFVARLGPNGTFDWVAPFASTSGRPFPLTQAQASPASVQVIGDTLYVQGAFSFGDLQLGGRTLFLARDRLAAWAEDVFLARIFLKPAGPPLSVSRDGETLLLSWLASASGFVLQSSPTLGSGAVWQDVTTEAVVIGDRKVVTVEATSGTRFFRLKKP